MKKNNKKYCNVYIYTVLKKSSITCTPVLQYYHLPAFFCVVFIS